MADRLEIIRGVNGLISSEKRAEAIRHISQQLEIETFIVFIPDPETATLLAAPGFPKTLPDGRRWRAFLADCVERSDVAQAMPWPGVDTVMPARALKSPDGSVLVFLGGKPAQADIDAVVLVLPLLTAALRSEQLNGMYAAQANLGSALVKQSENLAARLDEARRAAHKELIERQRADAALRLARAELQNHATKLEITVENRTRELRETIGELEAFSYSVSHDLRAPLRAMQSFSKILGEDCADQISPQGHEYIRRINTAAARMDALIQDVLTYSRVSRTDLPLQPVEVGRTLREILETYPAFQAPAANVELQGEFPTVMAIPAVLTQCIANLMGNAVKFVAPGVMPHIKVWAEKREGGKKSRLFLRDNGLGIESEAHETIFGIFQRVNKNHEGTGIGLSIVKKGAERMGGAVGLDSALGQGSTFWLDLVNTNGTH